MGKLCAVKSCRNAFDKTKLKPKKTAFSNVSFFQALSPIKLQQWTQSLGMTLKETDSICQFHFKEEDIEMQNKYLFDNIVHLYHHKRKRVKENALPLIEHQWKLKMEPKQPLIKLEAKNSDQEVEPIAKRKKSNTRSIKLKKCNTRTRTYNTRSNSNTKPIKNNMKGTVRNLHKIKDEGTKRLLEEVRRKKVPLTKLNKAKGFNKQRTDRHLDTTLDEAGRLQDSKPRVIGYVCDRAKSITPTVTLCKTTGKLTAAPAVVANGQRTPLHAPKRELKLRLIEDDTIGPMYVTVSDNETVREDDRKNIQNTVPALPMDKKLDSEYWKLKLGHILHNTRFCGVCLDADDELNELRDHFEIILNGTPHSRKLSDMVEAVFKDYDNLLSNSGICNSCTTSLIQSYVFIENTKEKSKMLNYHINELNDKTCYIQNTVLGDSEHCDIRNVVFSLENTLDDSEHCDRRNVVFSLENTLDDSEHCDRRNVVFSLENTDHRQIETNINNDKQTEKHKNEPFKCVKCNILLNSYKAWKIHKASHNTCNHKCKKCLQNFKTRRQILKKHKSHFRTICKICRALVQDGGLLLHLKKCHRKSTRLCKICNVVFYNSVALVAHNNLWHGRGGAKCVTCLRSFGEHELEVHKCRFKCPECSEALCVHHKYLMSYREQVLNLATRAKCPDCHYVTIDKGLLITHANVKHLKKV